MEDTNKALLILCDSIMKLGELYNKNISVLHSNYEELLETTKSINNTCIKNSNDLNELKINNSNNIGSNTNDLDKLYNDINILKSKVSDITDEFKNYQKVSIVKNLNDQLHQRDLDLDYLSKRLNKMENNIKDYSKVDTEVLQTELEVKVEQKIVLDEELEDTEYTDEAESSEVENRIEDENEEEEEDEEVIEVIEDTKNDVDKIVKPLEEDDEEVAELVEKMLKPKNGTKKIKFYVTDDEEKEIYEIMEDNEPGLEPIGKLTGKTNRVKWY